jgi:lipoprotein-releasing system permease protein
LNFSFYIAKRYLKSTTKNKAINIIGKISTLGIIAGSAALFIVLSGFSGLVDFSLSFSNKTDSDLNITAAVGKTFTMSDNDFAKIKAIADVEQCSKTLEERVLFVFNGKDQVAFLKGVDTNFVKVNSFSESVFEGNWIDYKTNQVVVGAAIAQKLSLGLLDFNNQLEVFVPKPGSGTIENPDDAFNKSVLIPVGFYSVVDDLDGKYVFSDLDLAQDLLGLRRNEISNLEVKLSPTADENIVRRKITEIFGTKVIIKNRLQMNDALYKMLNTENMVVYLIFTLVIILLLFAFVGAIIMIILDKKSNLKTLFNLGVAVSELRNIFLIQGTMLCFFGSIIGLVIGVAVVLIQINFSVLMINENMAYPMKFTFQNVFVVFFTITILGFMASFIASRRVNTKLLEI